MSELEKKPRGKRSPKIVTKTKVLKTATKYKKGLFEKNILSIVSSKEKIITSIMTKLLAVIEFDYEDGDQKSMVRNIEATIKLLSLMDVKKEDSVDWLSEVEDIKKEFLNKLDFIGPIQEVVL